MTRPAPGPLTGQPRCLPDGFSNPAATWIDYGVDDAPCPPDPAPGAFLALLLRRHGADTQAALDEVRELRAMSEWGHAWWVRVEHALEVRAALEVAPWPY